MSKNRRAGFVSYVFHRPYADVTLLRQGLFQNVFEKCRKLSCMDLKAHFGCVNAIEFSQNGELMSSGGDDKRVLLWSVEKMLSNHGSPISMKGEHHSNIFCMGFGHSGKKLYSGGNDEQVITHDLTTGETLNVFLHSEAVYCLSVHPENDEVFASAGDDGRVLIYDTREPPSEDPFCLANYTASMHSVMYNPVEPRLLATANSKEGIALWDVRKPKSCLQRYGGGLVAQSGMSVRWNHRGDHIVALRRRMPPVLYSLASTVAACEFDHQGYYNSCTMKSCCFAGDNDEYILSGSDDFNVYMWKIPDKDSDVSFVKDAHTVLRGHRSIVNQTRFNPSNGLVATSGVEKVVKIWSPFSIGAINDDDYQERPIYSHEEYINLVLRSGLMMTHDYSQESTEEDPRMMAFFDSLVQRELEGWSDSSDDDSILGLNDGETTDSARLQFYESVLRDASSNSDSDTTSVVGDADVVDDSDSGNQSSSSHQAVMENVAIGAQQILEAIDRVQRELDALSDHDGVAENEADSQNKRSISQLIAQKRNDHKNKSPKKRLKLKLKPPESTSSSTSISSLSSSSSESEAETNQKTVGIYNKAAMQNSNLKKLKRMRRKVLDSDSDSDDCETENNSTGQLNKSTKNCNFKEKSTKNGKPKTDLVSEKVPLGLSGDTCKNKLTETDSSGSDSLETDSAVGNLSLKSSSQSDNSVLASTSGTQPKSNTTEDSQPTWTKFKRFRGKLEKARRHYRNQGVGCQSSEDESKSRSKKTKK